MSNINYLVGSRAALLKLGVSNAWVQQKILNAYRKGVTPERQRRFIENMDDAFTRTSRNAERAPRESIDISKWKIPNTEPHPLRPDVAGQFYHEHDAAMADKALGARHALEGLAREYPDTSAVPEAFSDLHRSIPQPVVDTDYRSLRGDVYNLRQALSDIPEDVIEAIPVSPYGHPRSVYVRKLEKLDAQRDEPFTYFNREQKQRKFPPKKYPDEKIMENTPELTAAPTQPPINDKPNHMLRNMLITGGALAVPAAGYAAYKHYNPDKDQG